VLLVGSAPGGEGGFPWLNPRQPARLDREADPELDRRPSRRQRRKPVSNHRRDLADRRQRLLEVHLRQPTHARKSPGILPVLNHPNADHPATGRLSVNHTTSPAPIPGIPAPPARDQLESIATAQAYRANALTDATPTATNPRERSSQRPLRYAPTHTSADKLAQPDRQPAPVALAKNLASRSALSSHARCRALRGCVRG
jgi:hypothetical protein